jgi:hypothetical protein
VSSGTVWVRWCHGLREDDGAMGPGIVRVDGVTGSGMASGAQRRGLREDNIVAGSRTASWAWRQHLCGQQHHWLKSGKMAACKGARLWSGTTVRRLRGGLDDSVEAPWRTR